MPSSLFDTVVNFDHTPQARVLTDSWRDGWRSVLLRRLEDHRVADDVYIPEVREQLIVLVTQGEKHIESFDGARWHRGVHRPGRLAMTAPGHADQLRWRCVGDTPVRTLHLHLPGDEIATAVESVWEVDRDDATMPDVLVTDDPVVEQVMLGMADAHRRRLDDMYAQSAAAYLAVHLASTQIPLGPVPSRSVRELRVDQAKEFMTENMHRQITLSDIAASVHLSSYHFAHLFKQATGDSPRRWLTRTRIEHAQRRLRSGSLSLTEIAAQCGFHSASHLSTAFSRHVGLRPGEYRTLMR